MINGSYHESVDFTENTEFPNFNDFVSSFNDFDKKNSQTHESVDNSDASFFNLDMNTILKMKKLIDGMNNNQNSSRNNLLLSLKPYLRPERRPKIDQYIKLFNMGNIMENFNSMGGENKL